jgi:hypothetical protein
VSAAPEARMLGTHRPRPRGCAGNYNFTGVGTGVPGDAEQDKFVFPSVARYREWRRSRVSFTRPQPQALSRPQRHRAHEPVDRRFGAPPKIEYARHVRGAAGP